MRAYNMHTRHDRRRSHALSCLRTVSPRLAKAGDRNRDCHISSLSPPGCALLNLPKRAGTKWRSPSRLSSRGAGGRSQDLKREQVRRERPRGDNRERPLIGKSCWSSRSSSQSGRGTLVISSKHPWRCDHKVLNSKRYGDILQARKEALKLRQVPLFCIVSGGLGKVKK